ncbi:MAG: lytic transglycosylase F [Thermoanaerobaculales bacterium]|nr:lytic transglycosylase F [Thermoanaerobaculales bacterium]
MKLRPLSLVLVLSLYMLACSGGDEAAPAGNQAAPDAASELQSVAAVPPELVAELLEPFHGDFAAMVENRRIRVLVTYNKTNFFLDEGTQRGITAEFLREFETALNKELKLGSRPLHVMAIPVARDQLISYLEEGRGDIAVASLTITPERAKEVDFSAPAYDNVSELVVTGPGSPAIATLDDLAGKQVFVRPSSSYRESLEKLNATFRQRGLEEIVIAPVSEYLETEDLLEMVNAGLIGITIADDYLAEFWAQMFPNIMVHADVAVGTGQTIGWAIRRDATGLKAQVDQFIKVNRGGKMLGNMLIKRYLENTKFVKNALADKERDKFTATVDLFRKYSDQYGFDYLMVAAQGYQESGLDQSVVSPVGALGIMQVMPTTAADKSVGIPDISTPENNIHAGTKYLRYVVENFFDDPAIDEVNRTLFAFASYNAGPNRIQRLRGETASMGFDPNIWFGNVEVVVAKDVGREPVQYVSNIYKYYTVYSMLQDQREIKQGLKDEMKDKN